MKKLYAALLATAACFGGTEAFSSGLGSVHTPSNPAGALMEPGSDDIINQIIESIPSPLEITVLMKDKGIVYSKSNLNDHNSVSRYETNFKKSLNLGIYSTDLGYANIYGKTNDAIQYLDAVQELAKGLSIEQFFDYKTLKELAESADNLPELIQTTTRNFEKINHHLREQKRESISILLLTGGWIEATYLTTIIYSRQPSPELRDKIGEQKLVLERLKLVLDVYKTKADFPGLINDLNRLQAVYDEIEIETVEGKQKVIQSGDQIIILDETESRVIMTEQQVKDITRIVTEIRKKIIE